MYGSNAGERSEDMDHDDVIEDFNRSYYLNNSRAFKPTNAVLDPHTFIEKLTHVI